MFNENEQINKMDKVTFNMQQAIIDISEERLEKKLPKKITEKIRTNYQSYIGLEMIIDTVKSLKIEDLEKYLEEI